MTDPVDRVAPLLRARTGLAATGLTRARVRRCLEERARAVGMTLASYVDHLVADTGALEALSEEVTVRETSFFRHPEQLGLVRTLLAGDLAGPLLVWSAGCGTGEEAWSLAALLAGHGTARVVATDASATALAAAAHGRYPAAAVAHLPPEHRRWFTPVDGGTVDVSPALRRLVSFRPHRLSVDPLPVPTASCGLVLCRNVLIYLGPAEADRSLRSLHAALRPDGRLLLGGTEAPAAARRHFEVERCGDVLVHRPAAGVLDRRLPDRVAGPHREAGELLRAGEAAVAAGDLPAAVDAFRAAAYLDPSDPVPLVRLAWVFDSLDDTAGARRMYRAALATLAAAEASGAERLGAVVTDRLDLGTVEDLRRTLVRGAGEP